MDIKVGRHCYLTIDPTPQDERIVKIIETFIRSAIKTHKSDDPTIPKCLVRFENGVLTDGVRIYYATSQKEGYVVGEFFDRYKDRKFTASNIKFYDETPEEYKKKIMDTLKLNHSQTIARNR